MNLLTRIKKSNISLLDPIALRSFLIGKKVEIIGHVGPGNQANGNQHGVPLGKIWTISNNVLITLNGGNPDLAYIVDNTGHLSGGGAIYLHNIKVLNVRVSVNDFTAEIELIEAEEKKLKENKARARDIIKYMQENEIGDFDEKVYDIYKVIKKVKTAGSDIERATEIAKLL